MTLHKGKCKCACPKPQPGTLPVDYQLLVSTLQTVRVGGLLLTANEADNVARRILVEAATASLREE